MSVDLDWRTEQPPPFPLDVEVHDHFTGGDLRQFQSLAQALNLAARYVHVGEQVHPLGRAPRGKQLRQWFNQLRAMPHAIGIRNESRISSQFGSSQDGA